MPLPFKVSSLDEIDEGQRSLYKKQGEEFVLDVDGIESGEDVSGLKSALAKAKRELKDLKASAGNSVSDTDLEELEQLRADKAAAEEAKAREAGKFDELRAKLQDKHDKELAALRAQIERRDGVIESLTVTNELRSAIAKAGVKDEYRDAVEAMLLRRGPKVQWEEGKAPIGVFPDEVEGDQPIGTFVETWAKSEAASPYMPPENGGGGGGSGERSRGGKSKSWEGKQFSDMTTDEQIAFTNEKYGSAA